MKYLSLIPLAGLAIAAPSNPWEGADIKSSTTPAAVSTTTWGDAEVPVTETTTTSVTGTYCPKTGKITKPAPDNDVAKCTISVTKVTETVATATVTVTEGGKPGHGGPAKETVTVTETKTESAKECPTGKPEGPKPGDKCLTKEKAEKIVNNFRDLLEFTDFVPSAQQPGAPGRGYHQEISDATLDPKFVDISDSINLMAGFPLGSITFANKTAFDIGQGKLQPEVKTETLNIFHDCNSITWRWKITPLTGETSKPVNGINYFIVGENGLVTKNYAEFNNAAWLESFPKNPQTNINCALRPITVAPGAPAARN